MAPGPRLLRLGALALDLSRLADRVGPVRIEARCGARTRRGLPCRAPAMPHRKGGPLVIGGIVVAPLRYGRCRMHGGASTGPRTLEGKASITAGNRRRRRRTGSTPCMGSGRPAAGAGEA